jgi:hypothetical protein
MGRACWLVALATVLCTTGVATAANAATTSESLSAVSCVSAKFCVAVGTGPVDAKGTSGPISQFWSGVKWRRVAMKVPSGASPAEVAVQSVSCRSAVYCVAVGTSGTIPGGRPFAQTWNGRAWTLALLPRPAGVIDTSLEGVSCAAVRVCVADGFAETPSANDLPLVETLAGTKWTIRGGALPRGASGAIVGSVSCPAVTYCVLAGQYDFTAGFAPLFESWNGKAFARMKTPAPNGVAAAGVSCVSASSCVAVDDLVNLDNTVTSFAEVWNGRAWSLATTWPKGIPTDVLNAVSCARGGCMGAGATGPSLGVSEDGARAGAVVFNGRRWATANFPAPPRGDISELNGASCVSATVCVAVGQVGPSSGLLTAALTGFWNGKSWKLIAAA